MKNNWLFKPVNRFLQLGRTWAVCWPGFVSGCASLWRAVSAPGLHSSLREEGSASHSVHSLLLSARVSL